MARFDSWLVVGYCGAIIVTSGFGDPSGLANIPVLFILKDQLHFGPSSVALFETLVWIPHYAAFFFGVLRDRWSPLGLGDRGYLLVAAPVAAATYVWLAFTSPGYFNLLIAVFIGMTAYQFIDAVSHSLMATVAQRHAMTGRLSAFAELSESLALLAATFAGGWMVMHSSPQVTFLTAAAVSLIIFGIGFLKPRTVFSDRGAEHSDSNGLRAAMTQLRRIWPVAAVFVLYYFSPSWGTPLFFYLTDRLQLTPEIYGLCRAVTLAGTIAATVIYGFLCMRYPLKRLLWCAILFNIAPGALFLIIGGPNEAVAISAALGLVVGFANVALWDLLMRSCPVALEGSVSMMGVSVLGTAAAVGDLCGAWIYEQAGLAACILTDAAATLLVIPLLLKLPAELISLKEGASPDASTPTD